MAKRCHILSYDGDFNWIVFKMHQEPTSLMNPYHAPEGVVESIEFDPAKLVEIIELINRKE